MPKGAKRKKATKKKKPQTKLNSPTNSQHGNEDSKSHNEKGSDSGEALSPTRIEETPKQKQKENQFEEKQKKEVKKDSFPLGSIQQSHQNGYQQKDEVSWDEKKELPKLGQEHDEKVSRKCKFNEEENVDSSTIVKTHLVSLSEANNPEGEQVVSLCEGAFQFAEVMPVEKIEENLTSPEEVVTRDLNDEQMGEVAIRADGDLGSNLIESVKESHTNCGTISDMESQTVEKKEEYRMPQVEPSVELEEEETTFAPIVHVSSLSESYLRVEEKVVCFSEEVTQLVKDIPAEKLENLSQTDCPSKDSKEMSPALHATGTETRNGNGSRLRESSNNQVYVAPPTVRPTSWKSCCGLFDVLMGSNRL